MRLDKIIARSRIIDLRSTDLKGALEELLEVSASKFPDLKQETLLRGLLARESTMTTYLGFGVALPHVRVKMSRRYILAIGRTRVGIRHDGAKDDEPVRLILMLIADEKARDYLQVLASIARLVSEPAVVEDLVRAPDLDALYERLVGGFGGIRPVQAQQSRINRLMFREADRVAPAEVQGVHGATPSTGCTVVSVPAAAAASAQLVQAGSISWRTATTVVSRTKSTCSTTTASGSLPRRRATSRRTSSVAVTAQSSVIRSTRVWGRLPVSSTSQSAVSTTTSSTTASSMCFSGRALTRARTSAENV